MSESKLAYYMAFLGEQGLAHSSLRPYLAAVRQLQISEGLPDTSNASMPRLAQIMRGVKVVRGKEGAGGRKKLPITPSIFQKMASVKGSKGLAPIQADWDMLWAAMCVAFFGFLRAGEFTVPSQGAYDPSCHLNMSDVAANHTKAPSVIHIRIKVSKTDPFRKGTTVVLHRTDKWLCPVEALLRYLRRRGMQPGPLFVTSEGHPLTRSKFIGLVRLVLRLSGINDKHYTGHSFRVGAATTAAAAGVADSMIKAMGRWTSMAFLVYIRLPPEELQQVSEKLVAHLD